MTSRGMSEMRCRLALSFGAGLAALTWAGGAFAETLIEALSDAYVSNPTILAERANLRATDEGVPQALSGWRPTVTATISAGPQLIETHGPVSFEPKAGAIAQVQDFNVTQPLYSGGRTAAQTAQAEKNVESERARLVATEQTVFLSVIQAYLDVVRDQATLELSINNEQVLRRQLDATSDQFRVGSVTRTDVAQAEARLAAATASRLQAEGNLQVSRANYERAVGHLPGRLAQPDLRPTLPTTREDAVNLAATKNPNVVAAVFAEDAARDQIDVVRGQLLPSLNLVGDLNRTIDTQFVHTTVKSGSLIARVTVPLYEGGNVYSQTRQAQQVVGQRFSQTDDARRASVQGATQAFEQVAAGRAQVISLRATIAAAQIALEGVREEATVGSRTVLDVLNAEQELFTDQVQLVTTQHDLAVAEFTLAQQIGRLTATDLALPVKFYDADIHYRSVRDKWIGFSANPGEEGADKRR